MSRISDLLVIARDILADPNGDRWSDAVLLRRLNEGLKDVAIETEFFRAHANIPFVLNQAEYETPEDLISLKAGFTNDKEIDIISSENAEKMFGSKWRTHTTTSFVEKLIYDQLDNNRLRVYPIPKDYPAGSVLDQDLYGIFMSMTFSDQELIFSSNSDYGIVDQLAYNGEDFLLIEPGEDIYGLAIINLNTNATSLTIYYSCHLPALTTEDTDFSLSKAFDMCLAHFIAGSCLRFSVDAQNRAYGDEELAMYARDLAKITGLASKSSVSDKHFQTLYNGIG